MLNNNEPNTQDNERGQILILFSLLIVVALLFTMTVVDVGFFLHTRTQTQQAADAAALAGAQELPDNPTAAATVARDYLVLNGMDPAKADISFRCTSDTLLVCTKTNGKYDTIVVTPHKQAPSFFGGLLRIVGSGDSCWVTGCTVQATAAACRGACGPVSNAPVDVVVALDHSASMSSLDLNNAKASIKSLYEDFNYLYQTVGLSVTPPVKTTNHCDSIENWSQTYTWLSAPLTGNFQTSPHVLDNNSPPVKNSQCVENGGPPSSHTDVGSPLKASADELVAHGRVDVTHGIIMLTDGAANVAPTVTTTTTTTTVTPGDTGYNYCTVQAAVTSSAGDNNGYQTNASYACANAGGNAVDPDSGSGTSTTCASTQKDKHQFRTFGESTDIPSGATIVGMEVRVDAWANIPSGATTRELCIERTQNGSATTPTWTSVGNINLTGTAEQTYILGSASNLAGLGLTQSSFTDANFRIRMTMVSNVTTTDFSLDAVAVKVHYTTSSTSTSSTTTFSGSLGPCDWAVKQADAAKALGIEIFIIGWGVSTLDKCSADLTTSPYYNMKASVFLALLAPDAGHFFNEPKSEDLDPIFSAIGSQLTGGSRLVE